LKGAKKGVLLLIIASINPNQSIKANSIKYLLSSKNDNLIFILLVSREYSRMARDHSDITLHVEQYIPID
jgi:hypothetical protein